MSRILGVLLLFLALANVPAAADSEPLSARPVHSEQSFVNFTIRSYQPDLQNLELYGFLPYPVVEFVEALRPGADSLVETPWTSEYSNLTLLVRADGHWAAEIRPAFGEALVVELVPFNAQPFEATVRNREGRPVPGVDVYYFGLASPYVFESSATGDDGRASFEAPRQDGQVVIRTFSDYYLTTQSTYAIADRLADLEIEPRPGIVFLRGNIQDSQGSPIGGAVVRARLEITAGKPFYLQARDISDELGRFTLARFPGTATISFKHAGVEVLKTYNIVGNLSDTVVWGEDPPADAAQREQASPVNAARGGLAPPLLMLACLGGLVLIGRRMLR